MRLLFCFLLASSLTLFLALLCYILKKPIDCNYLKTKKCLHQCIDTLQEGKKR